MCQELGIHLHELLGWPGPMTHRQFLAWQAWRRIDVGVPGKTELYLANVAAEVRRTPGRVWGKEPDVALQDLFLKPAEEEDQNQLVQPGETEEEARKRIGAWQQSTMHARHGLDEHGRKPPRPKTAAEAVQEEADRIIRVDRAKRARKPETEADHVEATATVDDDEAIDAKATD